jgi:predicted HicB family RNase H-like nuclease
MKNLMRYRGYLARIDYDDADAVFVGHVLGLSETISFVGGSVAELRGDFEFAINHYLAACKAAGITPARQASGKLLMRLSIETHNALQVSAKAAHVSINDWLIDAVEQKLAASAEHH